MTSKKIILFTICLLLTLHLGCTEDLDKVYAFSYTSVDIKTDKLKHLEGTSEFNIYLFDENELEIVFLLEQVNFNDLFEYRFKYTLPHNKDGIYLKAGTVHFPYLLIGFDKRQEGNFRFGVSPSPPSIEFSNIQNKSKDFMKSFDNLIAENDIFKIYSNNKLEKNKPTFLKVKIDDHYSIDHILLHLIPHNDSQLNFIQYTKICAGPINDCVIGIVPTGDSLLLKAIAIPSTYHNEELFRSENPPITDHVFTIQLDK